MSAANTLGESTVDRIYFRLGINNIISAYSCVQLSLKSVQALAAFLTEIDLRTIKQAKQSNLHYDY